MISIIKEFGNELNLSSSYPSMAEQDRLSSLTFSMESYVLLVKTLYEEKRLQVMIDRDLKGCYEEEELEKAVELALLCTQAQTTSRPKMSEVWKVLEGITGQPCNLEETQTGATQQCDGRSFSFSRSYSDARDENSFILKAMELSGPR
ncbi:hypothetical protein Tco_1464158 [Tanacetum coccineum]